MDQYQQEIEIIKEILPIYDQYCSNCFCFKKMTGTSNITYQVTVCENLNSENTSIESSLNHSVENVSQQTSFIMRYIVDKGSFVNGEKEKELFLKLGKLGLGPGQLGYLKNDRYEVRLEEFIYGEHPSVQEYLDIYFRRGLVYSIIQFNLLDFPEFKQPPSLLDFAQEDSKLISEFSQKVNYLIDHTQNQNREILIEMSKIIEDKVRIKQLIGREQNLIKFCHSDLNRLNIILQKKNNKIDFFNLKVIDYEYAEYGFVGFDLANYFNEACFNLCEKDFPYFSYIKEYEAQDSQIQDFCYFYTAFSLFVENKIEISQETYEKCFDSLDYLIELVKIHNCDYEEFLQKCDEIVYQVKMFMILTHFYWAIWSVQMIQLDDINDPNNFSYLRYGYCRYQLYLQSKQRFNHIF